MIYKVSYVVQGGQYPGGIKNEYDKPEVGKTVQIGPMTFEVVEIHEIMPPRDDFQFLHATVRPIEDSDSGKKGKSGKKSSGAT
jgi:hypothetical protein